MRGCSLLLVSLLVAACGGGDAGVDAPGDVCALASDCEAGLECVDGACVAPPPRGTGVDVLFVIDDSAGSLPQQQALAAAFEDGFIGELERRHGSRPDLRIGVISTDMGAGGHLIPNCTDSADGRLQHLARVEGCTPPADPWLAAEGGATNFTGSIGEAFACVASLGDGGCGFEQPFAAVLAALDPANAANAGFLVEDHALAIVFVNGEDDCSAADPDLYEVPEARFGPLSSFRCFEHGVVCDGDDPTTPGRKTGCVPRTDGPLLDPAAVADAVRAAKPGRAVGVAVISGPLDPVSVELDFDRPLVEQSCATDTEILGHPPIRLDTFARDFADRASGSICDPMTTPLGAAAAMVAGLLE